MDDISSAVIIPDKKQIKTLLNDLNELISNKSIGLLLQGDFINYLGRLVNGIVSGVACNGND